jgi:CheY-like chemotaxis protein
VLLVDDDPDLRSALAAALTDHGHEVQAVGDGPAALALLETMTREGHTLPGWPCSTMRCRA